MKKLCCFMGLACLLFITVVPLQAQNKKNIPLLTADSLASGNYKDVLTSFFQLAFDKLTGPQKELKFSTNPYAIMLRANPELAVDTSYLKYKVLRNINVSFSIKLDTSYRFNGFSSGVSYALVNKRDYTVYREFISLVLAKNEEFNAFNKAVSAELPRLGNDTILRKKLREQSHKLLNDPNFTADQLSPEVKTIILRIIQQEQLTQISQILSSNPKASLNKSVVQGYEDVKKSFQNRLLWTVGVTDTTYKDQFLFSNVFLYTHLLKGISNPERRSNLELDITASMNMLDDSLKKGHDLKRSVFRFEPGMNWVLKEKANNQSLIEFKFTAEYRHIFGSLYPKEERERFTFNGSFRWRIIQDIWIPLDFKFDPKTGNVFGFLSVKANFNGLKKGTVN